MQSLIHSRKVPATIRKSLVLCAILAAGHLDAQSVEDEFGKDRIATRELDSSRPIIVRTMPTVTTTIQFPEVVDALDGKGMVVDESKDLGRFQIGWQPGSRFVSVIPLVTDGSMNINVITGGKVYVMLLVVDVHFDWIVRLVPQGSLELVENLLKRQQQQQKLAQMPEQPVAPELVTPAKAISFLDQCIMFPLLEQSKPEAIQGIYHRYNVGTITSYRQFNVELMSVFRQEALDALAFQVRFIPKQREAYYDPQGFGVRVGNDYYQQFLSKASGKVVQNPADPRENVAWFLVVGAGQGRERNNLAVTNLFLVNVPPEVPETGKLFSSSAPRQTDGKEVIKRQYGGKEIVTPRGSE
jgi:hypothetical protein